jgi:dihydropteroate synthase
MAAEGADGIDVGGESTRPQGARPVDEAEEIARVVPVIRELRRRLPAVLLSVDTVKSGVARAALDAGADVVNDVSAFRLDPAMAKTCAASGAGVILMHSRGAVHDMATFDHAHYSDDPTGDVLAELRERVGLARAAGVPDESIVVDPGIGFSKRGMHSLRVLAELPRLVALGYPVMVGVSRKRFIGEINGVSEASARVHGTVGANVAALERGARLFRVHDVAPNRQALDVAWAVMQSGAER